LAWVCGAAVLASLVPSWGAVARWLDGTDLLDGYRARWLGVYADPNHLAMSLVAIVPLAATFALFWRSWLLRLLGAVAAGLAVTAIVLTHSRGGALGLALAVVLWALSGAKRLRALAIVGALAAAVTFFAPKSFWERTETIAAYEEDVSAQGRIWAWEVASAINRDRPIAGVGAGAFRYAWPLYAPPEARGAAFVAHNIFLSELGELGLVGFMLFLVFLSRALAGAFKAARHPTVGPLARAVAAGLSGYILCDMMSGYVLSAHFFLLVALAAAAERLARQRADGLEQARRIP
jgi:O-antigen ligase